MPSKDWKTYWSFLIYRKKFALLQQKMCATIGLRLKFRLALRTCVLCWTTNKWSQLENMTMCVCTMSKLKGGLLLMWKWRTNMWPRWHTLFSLSTSCLWYWQEKNEYYIENTYKKPVGAITASKTEACLVSTSYNRHLYEHDLTTKALLTKVLDIQVVGYGTTFKVFHERSWERGRQWNGNVSRN